MAVKSMSPRTDFFCSWMDTLPETHLGLRSLRRRLHHYRHYIPQLPFTVCLACVACHLVFPNTITYMAHVDEARQDTGGAALNACSRLHARSVVCQVALRRGEELLVVVTPKDTRVYTDDIAAQYRHDDGSLRHYWCEIPLAHVARSGSVGTERRLALQPVTGTNILHGEDSPGSGSEVASSRGRFTQQLAAASRSCSLLHSRRISPLIESALHEIPAVSFPDEASGVVPPLGIDNPPAPTTLQPESDSAHAHVLAQSNIGSLEPHSTASHLSQGTLTRTPMGTPHNMSAPPQSTPMDAPHDMSAPHESALVLDLPPVAFGSAEQPEAFSPGSRREFELLPLDTRTFHADHTHVELAELVADDQDESMYASSQEYNSSHWDQIFPTPVSSTASVPPQRGQREFHDPTCVSYSRRVQYFPEQDPSDLGELPPSACLNRTVPIPLHMQEALYYHMCRSINVCIICPPQPVPEHSLTECRSPAGRMCAARFKRFVAETVYTGNPHQSHSLSCCLLPRKLLEGRHVDPRTGMCRYRHYVYLVSWMAWCDSRMKSTVEQLLECRIPDGQRLFSKWLLCTGYMQSTPRPRQEPVLHGFLLMFAVAYITHAIQSCGNSSKPSTVAKRV